MSVYDAIYGTADRLGVLDAVKPAARSALVAARRATGRESRRIRSYLDSAEVPKLHIGAGFYHMEGWLNSDYNPKPGVVVVDATKRFPFPDNAFRYVYCEHMIEHISFSDGAAMLKESARVLMPGGVVRVVTPNFPFLLDLYQRPGDGLNRRYMEWTASEMRRVGTGSEAPTPDPIFIINHFVRAWGHSFIYNEDSLALSLRNAGFTDVRTEAPNQSRHPDLRNLEHLDRLPPRFYEAESLVVEAEKPPVDPR